MISAATTPENILKITTGGWAAGILGTAVKHSVFTHLESGAKNASELGRAAGLSERGAQALLDAVTGFGLAKSENGRYSNTPDASSFLVEGKPAYLGGFVLFNFVDMTRWQDLPEAVQTGTPKINETADMPNNPFWELLVPAIAGLAAPVARQAGQRLRLAEAGPFTMLDVGGGSGIYSAIWLGLNPKAKAVQLDWPNVNVLARKFTERFGIADRFTQIDGDFHTADFGADKYDYAVFSNMAHQEDPQSNIAVFRKFRTALKPSGALLISDFVLNDDRTGNPFSMMFYCMMVSHTKSGATYRKADYRTWLTEAGFKEINFEATPSPSTLVFAR